MPQSNVDLKLYYKAETNYGGGVAGAEYACTGPTAVGSLTRVNLLAGDVKFNGKSFKRKRFAPPGITLGAGKVVTTGVEFAEIEFSYYLQTAADPFKAVAVTTDDRGSAGDSFIFQLIGPDPTEGGATIVYNIFGAQMTSYSIQASAKSEDPPIVTVKFSCFDVVVNSASVSTGALPAGVINEWDDIVVTLDSDAIAELTEFTLTIETSYTDSPSGRNSTWARFKPLITDKTFKYDVKFYKDAAAILPDALTEALNELTAVWTDGTNTITVTKCHVDSTNFLEFPGKEVDVVEYNLSIVNGDSVWS